jgi:hypothetical protein
VGELNNSREKQMQDRSKKNAQASAPHSFAALPEPKRRLSALDEAVNALSFVISFLFRRRRRKFLVLPDRQGAPVARLTGEI